MDSTGNFSGRGHFSNTLLVLLKFKHMVSFFSHNDRICLKTRVDGVLDVGSVKIVHFIKDG